MSSPMHDAITQLARTCYGTVGRADPRNQVFDAVIAGNSVAQQLIADDFAAQQDSAALYEHTRELSARRWADALTTMASLIGTAWVGAAALRNDQGGSAGAPLRDRARAVRKGEAQVMRSAWVIGVAVLLFAFSGCKDEGREKYLAARAQYVALVEKGTPPSDPAFDPVREKLASVPERSKAYADAQQLVHAIDEARRIPDKPLAVSPEGVSPTEEACAALARQLGAADGGERERVLQALARCREKLEREKATSHPEGEHGH